MTLTFVNHSRIDPRGNGITVPAGTQPGDLLILGIASDTWWVPWLWPNGVLDRFGRGRYTPPAGWTFVRSSGAAANDRFMAFAYRVATGTETPILTDIWSYWAWDAIMVCYRGAQVPRNTVLGDWFRWHPGWAPYGPVWPTQLEDPNAQAIQVWPTDQFGYRQPGPWWNTEVNVQVPGPGRGAVIALFASRRLGPTGFGGKTKPPVTVGGGYTLDAHVTTYDDWFPYWNSWEWDLPFFWYIMSARYTATGPKLTMPTSSWNWFPGWFFDTRFCSCSMLVGQGLGLTSFV